MAPGCTSRGATAHQATGTGLAVPAPTFPSPPLGPPASSPLVPPPERRCRLAGGMRVPGPTRRRQSCMDVTDWMLSRDEFLRLQDLHGTFTIDAACDDQGCNAQVTPFYSPSRSFLSAEVAGHQVWLHPPPSHASEFIEHYLSSKAASPSTTSAVIVVPKWRNAPWLPLLRGFQLVHEYPVGSLAFNRLSSSSQPTIEPVGPTPWAV